MKALLFLDTGKSSVEEIKKPIISDYDILMKVKACAICGTDIKLEKGSSTKLTKHGIKNIAFPRVTGHEFAGIIEKTGKKVSGFNEGERINVSPVIPCTKCYFCNINHQEICDNKITIGFDIDGGFAEYIKIPEIAINSGCVHPLAKDISFEEATFVEPLAVVINSRQRSQIKPDDTILVIGAGPIGLLQVQVAKLSGTSKIIVADISKDRLDFAGEFGADILIDNSKDNLVEVVLKSTNGKGADVIMICASAKEPFSESVNCTNKMGRINYFAGLSKNDPLVEIDVNLIHYNEISITGTSDSTPEQNKKAMDLINNHKINVKNLITNRFPLEEYFKGLELAKSGKAIKVIIDC